MSEKIILSQLRIRSSHIYERENSFLLSDLVGSDIDVGALISIPCSIQEGPLSTERLISCPINIEPPFNINGIVGDKFADEGKVVGVIYEKPTEEDVLVLLSGEIFHPGNPVRLPISWVIKNCKPVVST